jgi:hypothetical protein
MSNRLRPRRQFFKSMFIVPLLLVAFIVPYQTPSSAQAPLCPGNILKNGDFTSFTLAANNAGNGNFPPSSVSNWTTSSRTPQIANVAGCDKKPGHIRMWGNKGVGESISQTGLSIKKGYTYRLSACVKWPNTPQLPQYVRVNVRASNGLPSYTATGSTTPTIGIIGDPSNTPSISPPGIISQSWTTITLADWTATADFDTVTFNPENDFSDDDGAKTSWVHLDDVCLVEVSPRNECCVKFRPEAKLTNLQDLGNGLYNFTSFLSVNQSPITRVTANIISSSITYPSSKCGKAGPVSGYVLGAGNVQGFTSSVPVLNGNEAMWYGGGAQVNGQSFPMQIKFPPPPGGSCTDSLKFCVKYTFSDRECRGCEVIRCYGPFKRGGSIKVNESTERKNLTATP